MKSELTDEVAKWNEQSERNEYSQYVNANGEVIDSLILLR